MAEGLYWLDGAGASYTLYDGSDATRRVLEVMGLGLPPIELTMQRTPFDHGAVLIADAYLPREVKVTLHRNLTSRANWFAARQALAQAFTNEKGQGQFKWVDASANDWRLDAYVNGGLGLPAPTDHPWMIRDVVELIAPWPFWRPASVTTVTGNFNGATPVDIVVANTGDVATYPTTITLGVVTNPVVQVVGTAPKISLTYAITSGHTATVYCWPVNERRILLDAVTNITGYMSYDSTLAFQLPRSGCTVRLTAASGTGSFSMSYYPYYLAI